MMTCFVTNQQREKKQIPDELEGDLLPLEFCFYRASDKQITNLENKTILC